MSGEMRSNEEGTVEVVVKRSGTWGRLSTVSRPDQGLIKSVPSTGMAFLCQDWWNRCTTISSSGSGQLGTSTQMAILQQIWVHFEVSKADCCSPDPVMSFNRHNQLAQNFIPKEWVFTSTAVIDDEHQCCDRQQLVSLQGITDVDSDLFYYVSEEVLKLVVQKKSL